LQTRPLIKNITKRLLVGVLLILKEQTCIRTNMANVYHKNDEAGSNSHLLCRDTVSSNLTFKSVNLEIDGDDGVHQQAYRQVKHKKPFYLQVLDTGHAQVHCGDPIDTSVQQQEWSASPYQAYIPNQQLDSEVAPYQSMYIHGENEEPAYRLQAEEKELADYLQVIHNDVIDGPVQQNDQPANRNQACAINQKARRGDEAYSTSGNADNEKQLYLQAVESAFAGYLQVINDDPILRQVVQPKVSTATSNQQAIRDDPNSAGSGEYQEIHDSSQLQVMHSDPNNTESGEYHEITDCSSLRVPHNDPNNIADINVESEEYQDPITLGLERLDRSQSKYKFAFELLST
jgi:hypothetical protein